MNLTNLQAGVGEPGKWALNVIPTEATAGFDVRISPNLQPPDFKNMLDTWCQEAETESGNTGKVSWEFSPICTPWMSHKITNISARPDMRQPEIAETKWWEVFSEVCGKLGMQLETEIFPAATDSRFLRALGIPCFGFSPMNNCPILLHEHNEYIPIETFNKGIDIYEKLIPCLADATVEADSHVTPKIE